MSEGAGFGTSEISKVGRLHRFYLYLGEKTPGLDTRNKDGYLRMKRKALLYTVVGAIAAILLFAGCASSPEAAQETAAETEAPETPPEEVEGAPLPEEAEGDEEVQAVTVIPLAGSFSPEHSEEIGFAVTPGAPGEPDSYELAILNEAGETVATVSGTGVPPEQLGWNGRVDGAVAEEGRYNARFTVIYEDGREESLTSRPFLIDMTAPDLSLSFGNTPFSPDGDRRNEEVIITLSDEDASPIVRWEFVIVSTEGERLATFNDESDLPRTARWNGRGRGGVIVEPATEYRVEAVATDEAGNSGRGERGFMTDIFVSPEGDRLRVDVPAIQFPPYSAEAMATSGETLEINRRVIEGVARALRQFPSYNILIQGHANLINYDDPEAARIEQQEVLLPLSRQRAEMVRRALIERGIEAGRLEIEAVGANQPAAPFDDPDARFRNRRVVFYLQRQ